MATRLHLSAGELSWQVISSLFQSHHLQDPVDLVPASTLVAEEQGQLDILARGERRHEMELLEDEADDVEQRLLAGAGRPMMVTNSPASTRKSTFFEPHGSSLSRDGIPWSGRGLQYIIPDSLSVTFHPY